MDNQTPETIRTAAYLAARERLDARKTTRNIQCNPPNVRCGNRCIPPTWDCRLKGQGTDPHLRAVKTDPLGGLANIQRGFGRISRGIVRGNFSEVEGGKRAIIRGTVKITPGNIQQKKELQKKLENRTRAIGIGLAVVTGGLGIHALLMKSNTFGYKYGLGKQINESVHTGVSRVLDAIPLLGAQRARTRVGAFSSVSEAITRAARAPQAGGDGLVNGLSANSPEALQHLQSLKIGEANRSGSSNLAAAIRGVDTSTRESQSTNLYAWNQKHQEAFWGAKVNAPDLGEGDRRVRISVFARPAAEDFLVKQYNLPLENGGANAGTTSIKAALATKLIEEREMHVAYAKQLGLRTAKVSKEEVIHPDDINDYVLRLNKSAGITGSGTSKVIKDSAATYVAGLMDGRSLSKRANDLYAETVLGFDKLYGEVASKVRTTPGAASLSEGTSTRRIASPIPEGTQSLLTSLDRVRVGEMARSLGLPRNQIAGAGHNELIKAAYFSNRVLRSDKTNRSAYSLTDRVLQSAASELSGRPVTQPGEALRLLQSEHGFQGLTRVQAARATRQRPLTEGEAVYNLMRENPGMTLQAARREVKRRRGDADDFSPELVRTATYLAARADFKEGKRLGKPCGASHIPKAHECRKGQGAPTQEASPESVKPSRLGQKIALAAVVTAVGAVGVTVALDAHRFYNSKDLPNPPGYREAIRAAQAGDPKVGYDVAIGRHYDKVVSEQGWKPGQLVYTRYGSGSDKKDPTGHFAVYMGKNGDRHQFADFGVRSSSAREGEVNLYEYGPGSKGVAPFVFVKAPPLKRGTEPLSSEQIQQRVFSSLGARMKYDALDNNCETWARMITTGQARSAQVERLSVLTRGLYRFYDRKTAGALPKDIPSVKQQARILDMQARAASGDKSARADLKAFQALIKQGKRTDGMQRDTESELPTPSQLLSAATSDVDALIRTKLYLMLLIRQGEARAYGPA